MTFFIRGFPFVSPLTCVPASSANEHLVTNARDAAFVARAISQNPLAHHGLLQHKGACTSSHVRHRERSLCDHGVSSRRVRPALGARPQRNGPHLSPERKQRLIPAALVLQTISCQSALKLLEEDPNIQLIDIRLKEDFRETGSPDLRSVKKSPVNAAYKPTVQASQAGSQSTIAIGWAERLCRNSKVRPAIPTQAVRPRQASCPHHTIDASPCLLHRPLSPRLPCTASRPQSQHRRPRGHFCASPLTRESLSPEPACGNSVAADTDCSRSAEHA